MNVIDHPGQDSAATVGKASFEGEFHELLAGRTHAPEALSEGDDGEAYVFEILRHLYRTPPVVRNLPDIKPGTQLFDVFFDVGVMSNVALSRIQEALFVPGVVGHVITGDSQRQVIFGGSKPRGNHILTLVVTSLGREDEHEHRGYRSQSFD